MIDDGCWGVDQAVEWKDFQFEQILTPGHRLHAGMQGIHHNSAFPPQAPSHKIKFPLFSRLEDFPQGARSNILVESWQEEEDASTVKIAEGAEVKLWE